jgi:hypothetical protein
MGLLDDAIREHLDLKRRRGADPSEIERAEREALGPVRRGPEPAGEDEPATELAGEPEAGIPTTPPDQWDRFDDDEDGHETAPAVADQDEHEDHEELPPREAAEPAGEDSLSASRPVDTEAEPAPPPHPADVSPAPESELGITPDPAGAPASDPHPDLDQETEEYELEPEGEPDDDVLESTPEFLQDAPDHDRLWFEQRPPRDFDFDG